MPRARYFQRSQAKKVKRVTGSGGGGGGGRSTRRKHATLDVRGRSFNHLHKRRSIWGA